MKKFLSYIIIIVIVFSINICYSMELESKLIGKKIVIDIGHGGADSGSVVNGIKEEDINLSVATKLKNELQKNGVIVDMVRNDDYDLSSPNINRRKKSDFDNRIHFINESDADLYLSIHMNYLSDDRYYGAQVFYTPGNEVLAMVIQSSFNEYLNSPMKEKKLSNDIYMYKRLKVPGVLIECGFLSNKKELTLLTDSKYQDKIVNSIMKALIKYF